MSHVLEEYDEMGLPRAEVSMVMAEAETAEGMLDRAKYHTVTPVS
jgi:hypothetical protein